MIPKYPQRSLVPFIQQDLQKKMVFLGGPRQVGKTTLGLALLGATDETHPAYLNWDNLQDREKLLRGEIPSGGPLVLLDEIHKYARWRGFVKGLFDKNRSHLQFLVTGSARLDYYRKGGDSLQGRYHYYRLHPFSLSELDPTRRRSSLELLLKLGGFPEPLFSGLERDHRRWQREQFNLIVKEDIFSLEKVREISVMELLVHHLPACVGSPLSVGSLKDLLQASHESVERWVTILERLYVVFRIAPFGSKRIRAVKKEKKLYFWDWSRAPEGGPRFENLVASHLLKFCHWQEDTEGYDMELRYLRDTDKREVDFVVVKNGTPLFAVECKTGEAGPSAAAAYFKERTAIPRFYQVHLGQKDYGNEKSGIRVLPFTTFCNELQLP